MTNQVEVLKAAILEYFEEDREQRKRNHAEIMNALKNRKLFDNVERLFDLETK